MVADMVAGMLLTLAVHIMSVRVMRLMPGFIFTVAFIWSFSRW